MPFLAAMLRGVIYYTILPIVSIVIPQPITTGMVAFTDCNVYNNCDEIYRDLYMAGFGIVLTSWILGFCACCLICCGVAAAAKGSY